MENIITKRSDIGIDMSQTIAVTNQDLHKKIAAYELLFGRAPRIHTCFEFVDCDGTFVWGYCKVTKVHRTKVSFAADGEIWNAYIKDIKTFTFM